MSKRGFTRKLVSFFLFLLFLIPLAIAQNNPYGPVTDLSGQQVLFVEPTELTANPEDTINLTVQYNQQGGYIWKIGYYLNPQSQWKPFSFSGNVPAGAEWLLHSAQATLTIPSGDWQYGENAIIAYSCKQIGGSLDCGKQNQNDNQRRWRRHLFTVSQGGQQPKGNEAAMRIKEEADWIISCCKRATGALRLASNGNINPYFSNFAAEGLLVGGSDYSVDVKGWMQWYLAHLNRPDHLGVYGTVYDYSVTPAGVEQSTGNYDSSDSYAATFLSLVRKYYDATGDLQFIQDNLADLKVVAGAIDATLQPDGLTWAKKDYQIKYLMDNVEVWQGYSDFAYLLTLVDDPAAAQYSAKANQVRNGIEANLWDTVNQQYYPHFGGAMNWNTFYPNATANMWPLIFNLPEAEARTNALWQKFITNHPTWKTNQADAFPWTAHALAAIEAGDTTTAREFDENTRAKFLPARQWTWNTNEAGWYIRYTKRLY